MGVHPELLRRTDPNLIDVAFDAKEFYIECITDFKFEKENNLYSYFVKWLGYRPIYNTWEDEDVLPKPFIVDFWNELSSRDPKAYEQRLKWLEKPKPKTKSSKESRTKSQKLVVKLPPYNSDSDEDFERPVQNAPEIPVNNEYRDKTRQSRRLKDKFLMIGTEANFHYEEIEPDKPRGPWVIDANDYSTEELQSHVDQYTILCNPSYGQFEYITLSLPSNENKQVIRCFIDSGCGHSVMSYEIAYLLGARKTSEKVLAHVATADYNDKFEIRELTEPISVTYGIKTITTVFALRNHEENVLIGLDLIPKLGIQIRETPYFK